MAPFEGLLSGIVNLGGAAVPTPTPPPSPYRVFIPAVGASPGMAPEAALSWARFLESPWLYLALGALAGAWLALRALERRGGSRRK